MDWPGKVLKSGSLQGRGRLMGLNLSGFFSLVLWNRRSCSSRAVRAARNRCGEAPNKALYCTNLTFPISSCLRLKSVLPELAKNMFLENKMYYCAHLLTQLASEHSPQGEGLSLGAECRVMDVLSPSGSFGVPALGDRPLV